MSNHVSDRLKSSYARRSFLSRLIVQGRLNCYDYDPNLKCLEVEALKCELGEAVKLTSHYEKLKRVNQFYGYLH